MGPSWGTKISAGFRSKKLRRSGYASWNRGSLLPSPSWGFMKLRRCAPTRKLPNKNRGCHRGGLTARHPGGVYKNCRLEGRRAGISYFFIWFQPCAHKGMADPPTVMRLVPSEASVISPITVKSGWFFIFLASPGAMVNSSS